MGLGWEGANIHTIAPILGDFVAVMSMNLLKDGTTRRSAQAIGVNIGAVSQSFQNIIENL